jgi:hypothetical protein
MNEKEEKKVKNYKTSYELFSIVAARMKHGEKLYDYPS